jgi:hypothetical protein
LGAGKTGVFGQYPKPCWLPINKACVVVYLHLHQWLDALEGMVYCIPDETKFDHEVTLQR